MIATLVAPLLRAPEAEPVLGGSGAVALGTTVEVTEGDGDATAEGTADEVAPGVAAPVEPASGGGGPFPHVRPTGGTVRLMG